MVTAVSEHYECFPFDVEISQVLNVGHKIFHVSYKEQVFFHLYISFFIE